MNGHVVPSSLSRLARKRVLILNWRDVRHPQAGGAEQYIHQIARRWAAAGVMVTWFTARPGMLPGHDVIDGIHVHRFGGPLSLYPHAALRMLRTRGAFDVVVDCQNGIPFFSPLFAGADVPVVQVVHHVHQDQFATRFSPPLAAAGRLLEGRVARRVYGPRAIAAVSPSTRWELRSRLGFRGPIWVVPNGTIDVPTLTGPRDPDPTIAVVTRLAPHKRLDLLLGQIALASARLPRLRVEIIGDGPERGRLQDLVTDLSLQHIVTFHGYLADAERDALLSRAWLTASTSAAEGWGCSIIEAAAWGVPCLALRAPGIRDAVLPGNTGWLVDQAPDFADALVDALTEMAAPGKTAMMAAACQRWARSFSWDRSSELMAGVALDQMAAGYASSAEAVERLKSRSDIAAVARFRHPDGVDLRAALRATDEITTDGENVSVLLNGCDEFDAAGVLRRLGVFDAAIRLANHYDLLVGPSPAAVADHGNDRTSAGIL